LASGSAVGKGILKISSQYNAAEAFVKSLRPTF